MPATAIDEVLLERGRWVIRQIAAAGAGVAVDEDHEAVFASRAQYIGLPFVVDEEVIDSSGTLHCFVSNGGCPTAWRMIDGFGHFDVALAFVLSGHDLGTERSVRALVYDDGALPDSEEALTALLAARGADAAITETYDLLVPGVEPDDDAATRGIFVDQIHF